MEFVKSVLALGIFFAALSFPAKAQDSPDDEAIKRYEFEQLVRDYILSNPEVIAEAIHILNQRADTASRESTRQAILKNHDLLVNDPLSIVLGNPDGDVTLVEMYDYRCPYCRESHETIKRLIAEDPGLRLVLKQFPVKDRPGETPVSLISARIAKVAAEKGVFEAFHDAMFEADPPLTERRVYEIAKEAGLDLETLKQDMSDAEVTKHIRETLVLASEIGASGTPTFVIGEFMIPGMADYDFLKQYVDYVRAHKAD